MYYWGKINVIVCLLLPLFLQEIVVSKLATSLIALSKLSTCLKQQRIFASKKERLLWWRVRACGIEWKRAQRTPHSTAAAPPHLSSCRRTRRTNCTGSPVHTLKKTALDKFDSLLQSHKEVEPFFVLILLLSQRPNTFFLLCPWKVFANFG